MPSVFSCLPCISHHVWMRPVVPVAYGGGYSEELRQEKVGSRMTGGSRKASKKKRRIPKHVALRHDYLHRLGITNDESGGSRAPSPRAARAPHSCHPSNISSTCDSFVTCDVNVKSDQTDCSSTDSSSLLRSMSSFSETALNPPHFRLAYLQKLSYNGVWTPSVLRPQKHQTVVIIDWDDTLLCTSYLDDSSDEPEWLKGQLEQVEKAAKSLLEMALSCSSTVYIVTNAIAGWVEYSAAKYAPSLLPILQRMRVISARYRFEELHPQDVNQWKILAFLEIQQEFRTEVLTNLVCLGDSEFEFNAATVMGASFEEVFLKAVRFQNNPTPDELTTQLNTVAMNFTDLIREARDVTIQLQRKEHV